MRSAGVRERQRVKSARHIHLAMGSRKVLLAIGVAFHVFYLWSIFDIYFVSPLVHGMQQHGASARAPAKRLFLIVGDGLRADTTFEKVEHPASGRREFLAPYLRSLVLHNGTYGVSHTRMPTESRPGHVAMIAGFYEDVSAVTKGWKENPVDFDSVFNQSTVTYSFGSPDILPMFKHGAADPDSVKTWTYGHEFEDFTQSSIDLDAYVFEHLYALLHNATRNATLDAEIRQHGNVFFLHLLGCDTAGHSYRPYSAEYYDNLKYIDRQISLLVPKVNAFFQDDDTAFIFTADHGMSAFGSHGDGHPNNTRTPLIAWGRGINKPVRLETPSEPDNYTATWQLDHIKRNDVKQADIAALMSYLIGTNYPMNSVGELPLAYIDGNETDKLHALLQNAGSILEQYLVKEREVIESQFTYKRFHKFATKSHQEYLNQISNLIDEIASAGTSERGTMLEKQAIALVEELIQVTLEGLHYLTTYNWRFIRSIVTMGFLGWIVYSFTIFLKLFILQNDIPQTTSWLNYSITSLVALVLNYMLFYQNSPFNFYMYLLFPTYMWSQIFTNSKILSMGTTRFLRGTTLGQRLLVALSIFGIYEGIVYGFFHRWIFTFILNVLSMYPWACGFKGWKKNFAWIFTSAMLSIFTLFDAVKIENLNQINLASILIILSCIFVINKVSAECTLWTRNIFRLQVLLVFGAVYFTNKSAVSLQMREGLPRDSQIGGWLVIFLSLTVMPFLHFMRPNDDYRVRLFTVYLTLAPAFIILTISFESLFYFFFTAYIAQWIEIETEINEMNHKLQRDTSLPVVRVSLIGFLLLQFAFFGTGNVASISSFSLESVYRLLPIFDPFPMGALLMLKLIVPYIILSVGLGVLNLRLDITDYTISSLIISTSDILSLNFFYLLRTEGSWLDIGVTISNYCLAILSSLFMITLEVVSHVLLKNVKRGTDSTLKKDQ